MTIAARIEENLEAVRARFDGACARAGRDPAEVRLIAVSKYRPAEETRALYDAGVRDFGENRVQEACAKIPEMPGDIRWHLIGPLQTNKAKYLPGLLAEVHSVERMKVAAALEEEYGKRGLAVSVFVQVNVAGESQKSGCAPQDTEALVRGVAALGSVELAGLMTMAPYGTNAEQARPVFRALRKLRDEVSAATGIALPRLSMGMTNDFEVAIEEGATEVRVGTALYEGCDR